MLFSVPQTWHYERLYLNFQLLASIAYGHLIYHFLRPISLTFSVMINKNLFQLVQYVFHGFKCIH